MKTTNCIRKFRKSFESNVIFTIFFLVDLLQEQVHQFQIVSILMIRKQKNEKEKEREKTHTRILIFEKEILQDTQVEITIIRYQTRNYSIEKKRRNKP